MMSENKKTLFAAVVGRANTGKSSLINLLVGDKIAAVSDKAGTTRLNIRGIITQCDTQFVFTDTPGFYKRVKRLSEHMQKAARSALSLDNSGDIIVLVAEADKFPGKTEKNIIDNLATGDDATPVILILNKTDLVKNKSEILQVITAYSELYPFAEIIPLSALKKDNVTNLLGIFGKYSSALEDDEDFPFNPELSTDQNEKFFISEILREKFLRSTSEEIPHGIAVCVESLEYSKTTKGEPIVDIAFLVVCEKSNHKAIIIGKQGEKTKFASSKARIELENYFESKVNVKIWVKVVEDWRDKEKSIEEFGLNFYG